MSAYTQTPAIEIALVRRLLAGQFPGWSDLPITPVSRWGNVNAMYRLGGDMVVRLPRVEWGIPGMERELRWLPRLASRVSVPVPELLGAGVPAEGYAWPWCVYRWLDGENPVVGRLAAPESLAEDLAAFIASLHAIDASGGPASDQSLTLHDVSVREAIAGLDGLIDASAVLGSWEESLAAPEWGASPVWLHGDLTPGNILIDVDGRLSAVIDFSAVGVGDPAGDLRVAWNLLPGPVRERFRRALSFDEATWLRARGKAMAQSVNHLRYYRDENPVLASAAVEVIREILAE